MQVEIKDITPELAAVMLKANTRNRNLTPKVVAGYSRSMLRGDWVSNGESFKIAQDGTVLDGQHRLAAVVQSGITLRDMLVVSGLPLHTQLTMDSGRKRTTADAFKITGHGNVNVLASVTRRVWMWDRGNYRFVNTEAPTTVELVEVLEQYPSLLRSAEIGARTNGAFRPANATATGVAHHLFHTLDQSDTAEFFARIASGANLDEGDPILTLRDRLTREYAAPHSVTATFALALFIRSWNAYREGRKLSTIVQGKADPMPMPR